MSDHKNLYGYTEDEIRTAIYETGAGSSYDILYGKGVWGGDDRKDRLDNLMASYRARVHRKRQQAREEFWAEAEPIIKGVSLIASFLVTAVIVIFLLGSAIQFVANIHDRYEDRQYAENQAETRITKAVSIGQAAALSGLDPNSPAFLSLFNGDDFDYRFVGGFEGNPTIGVVQIGD